MTVPEHPTSSEHPIPSPSPSSSIAADGADGAARESVPQEWDEFRDPAFFALTARLFRPPVTLGMTVLLASYDVEPAPVRRGRDV